MADPNYFRFVHVGWAILIGSGLAVLTWSHYDPDGIPWIFGPLGQLGTYLGKTYPTLIRNMFYGTIAIHVAEALYSIKVCGDKHLSTSATIKWCLQTFVFGFASFLRLNKVKNIKSNWCLLREFHTKEKFTAVQPIPTVNLSTVTNHDIYLSNCFTIGWLKNLN